MKSIFKWVFFIPVLIGICLMASASNCTNGDKKKAPEITTKNNVLIDKSAHDFGTIKKADGEVSTVFKVTNNSKVPVLLQNVHASCGCTTPSYTKEPIAPGKTGEVKAIYRPSTEGPFEKTVTVTIGGGEEPEVVELKIKGIVE
jgi:hypothetical protein